MPSAPATSTVETTASSGATTSRSAKFERSLSQSKLEAPKKKKTRVVVDDEEAAALEMLDSLFESLAEDEESDSEEEETPVVSEAWWPKQRLTHADMMMADESPHAATSRYGAPPSHHGAPPSHHGAPPSHRGAPPTSHRGAPPMSNRGAPSSHRGAESSSWTRRLRRASDSDMPSRRDRSLAARADGSISSRGRRLWMRQEPWAGEDGSSSAPVRLGKATLRSNNRVRI